MGREHTLQRRADDRPLAGSQSDLHSCIDVLSSPGADVAGGTRLLGRGCALSGRERRATMATRRRGASSGENMEDLSRSRRRGQ